LKKVGACLTLALASLLSADCGGDRRPASTARSTVAVSPASAAEPDEEPDATYRVRGEIARLPASPGGEISIRHESIPAFRDRQGEVVGMMAMIMPFGVAPDASLDGLAVGDRVDFRLDIRWSASPPTAVGDFRKLPPGTRLEFDAAREAQPEAGSGATPR
jgi:Cu/Ag efflux protein CusF